MTAPPHPLIRATARLLRRVKTCRTQRVLEGGAVFYQRWRGPGMGWLAKLANLFLRQDRTQVFILETGAWLQWEVLAHRQLNGVTVETRGDDLVVPAFAGLSLAGCLASPARSLQQKLLALELALLALRQAHQVILPTPCGLSRPFAHGDAICGNVIVALEQNQAAWIDFETMHEEACSTAFRQADDLRALIMSAIELLGPAPFPAVLSLVKTTYPEPEVLTLLMEALSRRSRPMYHWAPGLCASLPIQ
jgi:hypothetical protein